MTSATSGQKMGRQKKISPVPDVFRGQKHLIVVVADLTTHIIYFGAKSPFSSNRFKAESGHHKTSEFLPHEVTSDSGCGSGHSLSTYSN